MGRQPHTHSLRHYYVSTALGAYEAKEALAVARMTNSGDDVGVTSCRSFYARQLYYLPSFTGDAFIYVSAFDCIQYFDAVI